MTPSSRLCLAVICLCALTAAEHKREAGNYDSSESRERQGRHFGGRIVSPHRQTSRGFSHFSPPRPTSFNVAPPHSPESRFSVFAATPHRSPNTFFAQTPSGNAAKILPATLTHFQQKIGIHEHPHSSNSFSLGIQPGVPTLSRFKVGQPEQQRHRFSPANPFVQQQAQYTPQARTSCPGYLECQPVAFCAPFYEFIVQQSDSRCALHGGDYGVCCPPIQRPQVRPRLFERSPVRVPIRRFSMSEINDAAREGLYELMKRDEFDRVLQQRNIVVSDVNRPAYQHLQFFRSNPMSQKIARNSLTIVLVSGALARRFQLSTQEAAFGLEEFDVRNTVIDETCPQRIQCNRKNDFYRTSDGSCNNLQNPRLGSARTPFNRILPARYENGIESPTTLSRVGVNLPSARVVSISNIVDADRPSSSLSLAVMQWGQFIDHDLAHAPVKRFGPESGVECCNAQGQFVDNSFKHPACFPIEIPVDDPFFKQFNRRCMNFVRSETAPSTNCTLGAKEQMNQLTHFLDASTVYGSAAEEERALRSFQGGQLKVQQGSLLPADPTLAEDECRLSGTGRSCFLAGDNRVNEQPHLTVIHTVWVRQHNRIAQELARINPHWNDETLYQETRRIVTAQIQHIVYNEWLPLILGTDFSLKNGLLPLKDGFSAEYDPSIDPSILNEFAAVAFRFGHTLVEGMLELFDKNHRKTETLTLHEHFNAPRQIYTPGKLEEFLRGLSKQPMQNFDNFVTESLTNRLFQTPTMPFGMDLIALNIQRGRDHAVGTYNELREACGLGRARTFEDFSDTLSERTIKTFQLLYPSVDDIDPFIGGISERSVQGGVVGPLFRCIIADQFQRLRRGDRFFYDNGGMRSSFTEAQLHEIRKTSWAGIICANGMHIKAVQPLAMRLPGPLNEKVSCSSSAIPSVDLAAWTAEPKYT